MEVGRAVFHRRTFTDNLIATQFGVIELYAKDSRRRSSIIRQGQIEVHADSEAARWTDYARIAGASNIRIMQAGLPAGLEPTYVEEMLTTPARYMGVELADSSLDPFVRPSDQGRLPSVTRSYVVMTGQDTAPVLFHREYLPGLTTLSHITLDAPSQVVARYGRHALHPLTGAECVRLGNLLQHEFVPDMQSLTRLGVD